MLVAAIVLQCEKFDFNIVVRYELLGHEHDETEEKVYGSRRLYETEAPGYREAEILSIACNFPLYWPNGQSQLLHL
jgi:hypothetical protein